MPNLLVTDLDEATLRTIAFQAEATNQSVEAVARALIRIGLLHDSEGRSAVARRIREHARAEQDEDSTALIRQLRGSL